MKSDSDIFRILFDQSPNCELFLDTKGAILYESEMCSRVFAQNAELKMRLIDLSKSSDGAICEFVSSVPGNGKTYESHLCNSRMIYEGDTYLGMKISISQVIDLESYAGNLSNSIDKLTGLQSKECCIKRLDTLRHEVITNEEREYSSIYVDIDRLKKINDAYGYNVGDLIIKKTATRLYEAIRGEGEIFRLAGDEFFILLDNTSAKETIKIAKRIIRSFEKPYSVEGNDHTVSASIGIVVSPTNFENSSDLIRSANIAVRVAKKKRYKYKVFTASMLRHAMKSAALEVDMPQALMEGQFYLDYQPIISLESHSLKGVEALIRWNHPEWGLVNPSEFIPLAEENEFIMVLGEWVLLKACSDMRKLMAVDSSYADLTVAVNLSAVQLGSHDIVNAIKNILEKTQLPPKNLKIEITETLAMTNPELTAKRLEALKAIGIRVSIDDFGTGYSSLSHLQSFPVDTIKVDRSFVSQMSRNPKKRKIVKSVINLAHNLKMNVIAEGIEINEQWSMLKALDCESGQGFLFSRPLAFSSILEMLESGLAKQLDK